MQCGLVFRTGAVVALSLLACTSVAAQIRFEDQPFDAQVLRPSGQPVIPVYDGWYENNDGTITMCFSYFNLNTEESHDIPLGPGNNLVPAEYDGVQPTHFDPVPNPKLTEKYRHHWCVFTVQVPAGFQGDVVWTLATGVDTLSTPGRLHPLYILEEPVSAGRMVTAPSLAFAENAPKVMGRNGLRTGPLKARVGEPLAITTWVEQTPSDLLTWLGWYKHQGPGDVTFSDEELLLERPGSATTSVTFSEPGDYVLRVQAINNPEFPRNPTGSFEFHCCWTNGYVEVSVSP